MHERTARPAGWSPDPDVSDAGVLVRPAAVVVDRWPLMRLGIGRALELADIPCVGQGDDVAEGLRVLRGADAEILVLADGTRGDALALAGLADRGERLPKVVMLVRQTNRADLTAILEAGVRGVGLRSLRPEELADLVLRVSAGERVISPVLLPSLAGFRDHHAAPLASGADQPGQEGTAKDGLATPLTAKERQVLVQLAVWATNQQIADALYVTPATVKSHLAHIYAKLGVRSRHDAISRAVALGLIH